MSSTNALQAIVGGIADFYAFLSDQLSDEAARQEILIDLGLPPSLKISDPMPQNHQLPGINAYRKSLDVAQDAANVTAGDLAKLLGIPDNRAAKLALPGGSFEATLAAVRAFAEAPEPGMSDYREVLGHLKKLFEATREFVKTLKGTDVPTDLGELVQRLLDIVGADYVRIHYPRAYWTLQPFAYATELLLEIVPNAPGAKSNPVSAYAKSLVSLLALIPFHIALLLKLPVAEDEDDAQVKSDILGAMLVTGTTLFLKDTLTPDGSGSFLRQTFEPHYGWDTFAGSTTPRADRISERTLSFRLSRTKFTPGPPLKEESQSADATMILIPKDQGGPGAYFSFGGGLSFTLPLGDDWQFKIASEVQGGFDFFVGNQNGLQGPDSDTRKKISLSLESTGQDPIYRLGAEDGSHLEFGQVAIVGELSPGTAALKAVTRKSELVLNFAKSGNSFLAEALGGEKRIPLNFGVGVSKDRGLFLDDGKDLSFAPAQKPQQPGSEAVPLEGPPGSGEAVSDQPLDRIAPVGKTFGPVRIQFLSVNLTPRVSGGQALVTLAATVAFDFKLGPVTASMDKTGFQLKADFKNANPNLGLFDLDFGFQPPRAIGLDIDAKVVRGGGFLYLDPERAEYGGAIHLEISGGIAVDAIGLLNTRLPGGAPGFSLLIIITAKGFRPIPIGFGFMLTGIGGLLGIHRTANEDAIRAGVRNDTLSAVLAPKDLIRNAPQYLSTLGTLFPVARNHYLFGPVVQITWGVPALITLNLALIFEFGARTRFLVLGQLLAILPKRDLDLVRLQMNIAGGVDFDRKQAFLEAALYDSRLVNRFVITGEMRMRLNWGDRPAFALAVGGLHPAFTPPPGLERMQRMAIVFADSENLKLRCESYFAITSNTVQFGARVDLFAKKSKFSVEGHAGYDVLIQFSPFHFIASIFASLQLKAFGRNLFKVSFKGELSGPRPLHVKGQATFEILWWDYSVSFDRTLVEGEKPPLPAPIDVRPLMLEALRDVSSWSAEMPRGGTQLVSLNQTAGAAVVRVHPLGNLTIKQKVAPLNLEITRFGTSVPAGGPQRFQVVSVQLGTLRPSDPNPPLVRDHFAPAQFQDMTDDAKLSSPSFAELPAGVRIEDDRAGFGTAVAAALEYEEILVPAPPTPKRRPVIVKAVDSMVLSSAAARSRAGQPEGNRYHFQPVEFQAPVKTFVSVTPSAAGVNGLVFTTRAEAIDALRRNQVVRNLQITVAQG